MEEDAPPPPEEILRTTEGTLQRLLRRKPPPNYVARVLEKSELPEDDGAWIDAVRALGGSSVYELADSLSLHEPQISNLNHEIFNSEIGILEEAIELLKRACKAPGFFQSPSQRAGAVECLAYLLTERHLGWLVAGSGGIPLNPDNPSLIEALDRAEQALELSLECENYFLASRAAYNIGRIHYDAGLSPQVAANLEHAAASTEAEWLKKGTEALLKGDRRIRRELALEPLLASFNYWVRSLSTDIRPPDDYSELRRVEALHRLIGLVAANAETLELVPTLAEFLKMPQLSLKAAHRVVGHRPAAADMMAIKDSVPAVYFDFGAIARGLDAETAVFNYAILEDMVSLTLIQGGKMFSKVFHPSRVGEFWEGFFRPTSIGIEPFRSRGTDLYWRVSMDVLHLTPKARNQWGTILERDVFILGRDAGWQMTLHDMLIAPFEAQLQQSGVKHLMFMADLALMLIPFHLFENSAGVPLGQRYRVSYCPSFALLVDALSRPMDAPGEKSVLIVSDPTDTLPFVPWERAMVASLFPPEKVRVLDSSTATNPIAHLS